MYHWCDSRCDPVCPQQLPSQLYKPICVRMQLQTFMTNSCAYSYINTHLTKLGSLLRVSKTPRDIVALPIRPVHINSLELGRHLAAELDHCRLLVLANPAHVGVVTGAASIHLLRVYTILQQDRKIHYRLFGRKSLVRSRKHGSKLQSAVD